MSYSPTVSVLVTVYNRAHLLRETAESILNSNYRDYELILVDDCSSDNSFEIAQDLERMDSRVRAFLNAKNLGDYGNRNEAASKARGKYLKYVDADDLIYPYTLEVMVDAMKRFPDAAFALSSNMIDPPKPFPFCTTSQDAIRAHFMGTSLFGVGPTAAIIRTDAFRQLGGFSGRQFIGDTELWYKLAEDWPLISLPPSLVWWRTHEGQQMQLELKTPQILNTRHNWELETLRLTKHLNAEEKARVTERLNQVHARRILSMMSRNRSLKHSWNAYQESDLSVSDMLRGLKGYPKS